MSDKKNVNVDELLMISNEAVSKMSDIFSELAKKEEIANDKEFKEMYGKLVKVKEKRS